MKAAFAGGTPRLKETTSNDVREREFVCPLSVLVVAADIYFAADGTHAR